MNVTGLASPTNVVCFELVAGFARHQHGALDVRLTQCEESSPFCVASPTRIAARPVVRTLLSQRSEISVTTTQRIPPEKNFSVVVDWLHLARDLLNDEPGDTSCRLKE